MLRRMLCFYQPKEVSAYDDDGNLVGTYSSAVEAARVHGGYPSNIRSAARGEQKKSKGLRWEYTDPRPLYHKIKNWANQWTKKK